MMWIRQAVVLAGGRGSRLGSLTESTPKPLLPVAGRPFLEYLICWLTGQGVSDIVMSVGYLAGAIEKYFGDGARFGVNMQYAVEEEPLGTGGGVRLARKWLVPSQPCLIVNGDTVFDAPVAALAGLLEKTSAQAGMMLRRVADIGRYGGVTVSGGFVTSFAEKGGHGEGLINGGMYLLTPAALDRLAEGHSSLEKDVFPAMAREGLLAGQESDGFFLDIGLPETFETAQRLLPQWLQG